MRNVCFFRKDEGSVLLFGIGIGIVALLVLTTAINVATLWVTRSKLDSIADATALAASHSIDVRHIYISGLSQTIKLDEQLAKRKAQAYLNELGAGAKLTNFKVLEIRVHQNSVLVTIQATAELPFGYLLPGPLPVVVSSAKASLKTF